MEDKTVASLPKSYMHLAANHFWEWISALFNLVLGLLPANLLISQDLISSLAPISTKAGVSTTLHV